MISKNDRFRTRLGFDKFLSAGYTGKNVTAIFGEDFNSFPSGHPGRVYRTFREFCPDAKILYAPLVTTSGQEFITETIPLILKTRACLCGASLMAIDSRCNGVQYDAPLEAIKSFCTVSMSVGNSGTDQYNIMLDSKYIYGVGAYRIEMDTNKFVPMEYSSVTEKVDFCGPTYVWIPSPDGTGEELFDGTSCAWPVICAMQALINDFFIVKTGKPLSGPMMVKFLKDYSKDLSVLGFDKKTGWGAPILPDPNDIDIEKYREWSIMDFKDSASISEWAKADVEYIVNLGLMDGDTSKNFNPKSSVTREQMAAVIARLYRKLAE